MLCLGIKCQEIHPFHKGGYSLIARLYHEGGK